MQIVEKKSNENSPDADEYAENNSQEDDYNDVAETKVQTNVSLSSSNVNTDETGGTPT